MAEPSRRPDPRNRFAEMLDDLQGSGVGQALRPVANAVTGLADNPYVQKAQAIGNVVLNPFGAIGQATSELFDGNDREPDQDADDMPSDLPRDLPPMPGPDDQKTFGVPTDPHLGDLPIMHPAQPPASPQLLASRDLPIMGSPEQMAMFTRPEGNYDAVPSWGPNAGVGFQMPSDNMDEALDAYQMMQQPTPPMAKPAAPPAAMAPGGQRGPMRRRP